MTSLIVDVSLDGLLLNGRVFDSPVQPSEYVAVLGTPARVVEPSPPAPYGHRNNQIHLFDEFGLYLIEDHASRLVISVVFVLWLDETPFKPARELTGLFTVGGVRVFSGMLESDYSGGSIEFEGPTLGLRHVERDGVWIGLKTMGIRLANRRRGKRLRFVDVSICFSKALDRKPS